MTQAAEASQLVVDASVAIFPLVHQYTIAFYDALYLALSRELGVWVVRLPGKAPSPGSSWSR